MYSVYGFFTHLFFKDDCSVAPLIDKWFIMFKFIIMQTYHFISFRRKWKMYVWDWLYSWSRQQKFSCFFLFFVENDTGLRLLVQRLRGHLDDHWCKDDRSNVFLTALLTWWGRWPGVWTRNWSCRRISCTQPLSSNLLKISTPTY